MVNLNLGNLKRIGAKVLNGTEKAIAKKAFQTMHSVNDKMEPINHAIGKAEKAVVKTIKSPIINAKEVDGSRERLSNFYTGKKINPLHMAVIGGGYLAATNSYNGASHALQPLRLATQNVEQGGAPDALMYDGVGQQAVPQNMNAEGSLVFGLHNMRRG